MHPKKVISKTSLTNMSKSGKSAHFRYIFLHFFNGFEAKCAKKRLKKQKTFFINMSQNLVMQTSTGQCNQVVKIVVPLRTVCTVWEHSQLSYLSVFFSCLLSGYSACCRYFNLFIRITSQERTPSSFRTPSFLLSIRF